MKTLLLLIHSIGLLTPTFGQPDFCKSDILTLSAIESGQFTYLTIDSGRKVPVYSEYMHDKNGYPAVECSLIPIYLCNEFPSNRFLAINEQNQYFVVDSSFSVLVGPADSIIGLSMPCRDFSSAYHVKCSRPSTQATNRSRIYYQSITKGLTSLYDYHGCLLNTIPFAGRLFELVPILEIESYPYLVVRPINSDNHTDTMGLIHSSGKSIIPFDRLSISSYSYYPSRYGYLWRCTISPDSAYLFNAKTGEIVLRYSYSAGNYASGVFIFSRDDKFGIYHPLQGVIFPPKYDEIYSEKGDTFRLTREIPTKREHAEEVKIWVIPKALK